MFKLSPALFAALLKLEALAASAALCARAQSLAIVADSGDRVALKRELHELFRSVCVVSEAQSLDYCEGVLGTSLEQDLRVDGAPGAGADIMVDHAALMTLIAADLARLDAAPPEAPRGPADVVPFRRAGS